MPAEVELEELGAAELLDDAAGAPEAELDPEVLDEDEELAVVLKVENVDTEDKSALKSDKVVAVVPVVEEEPELEEELELLVEVIDVLPAQAGRVATQTLLTG